MSKNLSELKPWDKAYPIQVKVYRIWVNSNPPNPTPTGYCCILLDHEGNAIQANMDFADRDYFDQLIETSKCYIISDYICECGKQWMMSIEHETTLKFVRHTNFEHIPDDDFPSYYFRFVSFNQLQPRLNNHRVLTDYMACLRSVSEVKQSGNPNKNTNVRRILELENLNGDIIELTIWNQMAQNFDANAFSSMPKPVLIAVSSCRVTMYKEL